MSPPPTLGEEKLLLHPFAGGSRKGDSRTRVARPIPFQERNARERERERNRRRRFVIIDEYTCPDRREGGKNYNVLRTIVINENEILLPSLSKVQLGGIVKIPLLLLLSTWRACPSNPHELASSIDRSTSIL